LKNSYANMATQTNIRFFLISSSENQASSLPFRSLKDETIMPKYSFRKFLFGKPLSINFNLNRTGFGWT